MTARSNSDITLPEIELPAPGRAGQTPCLTVLYHPDVSRIGDRLQICLKDSDAEVSLHRFGPDFSDIEEQTAKPLGDQHLSRAPLRFRSHEQGLEVDATDHGSSVALAGQRLDSRHTLSVEEIGRGVSLMLARRIVLLIHYGPEEYSSAPDCGLIGQGAAMLRIRELVARIAKESSPVLLMGE